MTHLVYGYPTIQESQKLFSILEKYSSHIEIQIPFSDPIADGTTISKANSVALKQRDNISTEDIFSFIRRRKNNRNQHILVMCYFHTVFRYGIDKFVKDAAQSQVYGLIIPDIPLDEAEWKKLYESCEKYGLYFIVTVSPNCSNERLLFLSKYARWFVYAISQNITTGSCGKFWKEFSRYINKLRGYFNIPIWVGFWLQSIEDIRKVNALADFSIVGSKIVQIFSNGNPSKVDKFLRKI